MEFKAFFVLVLLIFLFVPVHAGEINPSVESQPFFCRYSLTDWTPLCVQGGTGIGSTSINAENNTFYYNSTSNETYIFSNETSLFNITIGNNLTTISNYTYFTLVNITYSEMNQTPGPQGPQGVNGTPGADGYTPVFGVDYFNGSDGAPGPQGEKGDKGDKGDQGDIGPQGPAGAAGAANMTAGPQGPQGEQGVQGIQGIQGIQGEKGDKGDKGDTGDTGPMNMTSNMTAGPQGEPGPDNDEWYLWVNGTRQMAGTLNAGGYNISNVSDPVANQDSATKAYVDLHTPTFKGVSVTNTTDTALATSAFTSLKYYTEVFDTDAIHNTSANVDRLTATTAGYYHIVLTARFVHTGGAGTIVYYNGVTPIAGEFASSTAASLPTLLSASVVYYLNAGDFVNSSAYSGAAGTKVYYAANYSPVFSMYKVG